MSVTRSLRACLGLASLLVLATLAGAATPRILTLQGEMRGTPFLPGVPVSCGVELYHQATGGTFFKSWGEMITVDSEGRFTVTLGDDGHTLAPADFETPVWAEVRTDLEGDTWTLSPRLPLSYAPYAMRAALAEGLAPPQEVYVEYAGSASASGAALAAAMAGITDASLSKRYVVHVGPGSYDLSSAGTLVVPPHVDLAGSGRDATVLTWASAAPGLVVSASAETWIHDLAIENVADGATPGGLRLAGVDTIRVSDLRVAVGSSSCLSTLGLEVVGGGSAPRLERVAVEVTGQGAIAQNRAVLASHLEAEDCEFLVAGGQNAYGVVVTGEAVLRRCRVVASGATSQTRGIDLQNTAPTGLYHGVVEVAGSGGTAIGLRLAGSSTTEAYWTRVEVTAGGTQQALSFVSGGGKVFFGDLQVASGTAIVSYASSGTLDVGLSRAVGTTYGAPALTTCERSHRANGTELSSTCQ